MSKGAPGARGEPWLRAHRLPGAGDLGGTVWWDFYPHRPGICAWSPKSGFSGGRRCDAVQHVQRHPGHRPDGAVVANLGRRSWTSRSASRKAPDTRSRSAAPTATASRGPFDLTVYFDPDTDRDGLVDSLDGCPGESGGSRHPRLSRHRPRWRDRSQRPLPRPSRDRGPCRLPGPRPRRQDRSRRRLPAREPRAASATATTTAAPTSSCSSRRPCSSPAASARAASATGSGSNKLVVSVDPARHSRKRLVHQARLQEGQEGGGQERARSVLPRPGPEGGRRPHDLDVEEGLPGPPVTYWIQANDLKKTSLHCLKSGGRCAARASSGCADVSSPARIAAACGVLVAVFVVALVVGRAQRGCRGQRRRVRRGQGDDRLPDLDARPQARRDRGDPAHRSVRSRSKPRTPTSSSGPAASVQSSTPRRARPPAPARSSRRWLAAAAARPRPHPCPARPARARRPRRPAGRPRPTPS